MNGSLASAVVDAVWHAATIRYQGDDEQAVAVKIGDRNGMPRYAVEVSRGGGVVESFAVLGRIVLTDLAYRRGWTEVGA